jgi:hypothetical protein
MNEQLIGERARAGVRGFASVFAVMMCCISSDEGFFHRRWPLFVSAPEPTIGSEK